jgi:hypothetical protein
MQEKERWYMTTVAQNRKWKDFVNYFNKDGEIHVLHFDQGLNEVIPEAGLKAPFYKTVQVGDLTPFRLTETINRKL